MLPVAVMGPMVGKDISGANHIIQMMLERAMPALPDIYIPIVDVRDVARAHLLAAVSPNAAGERFLLSNGPALALKDIAATIKASLGSAAGRVPTRTLPSFIIRIGARFSNRFQAFVHDLGYAKQTSNEKARRMLGWTPREPREAIIAAARSLVASGNTGQ
ncbi:MULTISPECIES: hypothetical protein [Pandoraea]|uniref:hypothetical protein n=1 Tax=Pandoraea TaxID=93217 RepID=UPI001F5DE2C9|nr:MULTISPECIES: hypothetical protein [Pandoraea]